MIPSIAPLDNSFISSSIKVAGKRGLAASCINTKLAFFDIFSNPLKTLSSRVLPPLTICVIFSYFLILA